MERQHSSFNDDYVNAYLSFCASRFPVMCSSDEFHLLPRAQAADRFAHRLEDLDPDAIQDSVSKLKTFRRVVANENQPPQDLSEEIDRALVGANIDGLLFDLEEIQSWRCNPLMYLKIGMIGLDHALNRTTCDSHQPFDSFVSRLRRLPRLLRQGITNLCSVAEQDLSASGKMVVDVFQYLDELKARLARQGKEAEPEFRNVAEALEEFSRALQSLPLRSQRHHNRRIYRVRLGEHFLSRRSPAEIFHIASREWEQALASLNRLQAKIDPGRSWQQLYSDYTPSGLLEDDLDALYRKEIDRLIRYFADRSFPGTTMLPPLVLAETPTYLRSVRSAASFSAALSNRSGDGDIFYLTTRPDRHRSGSALHDLRRRLHREYRFLCAHETVPGHHLLDSVRRSLDNPVRRQIESPLFYEGWAYFAESLLFPFGYLNTPMERLVDAKRRLWRAARCLIDVGLAEARITTKEATALLEKVGFSAPEALSQVERFQLNPGYQTCYTLGRYELEALQLRYRSRLDTLGFCQAVLCEGQIPFHLLDRRLQQVSEQDSNYKE